jgi:succinate dehydrogenase/fumarate reductase flavoprotein subunit
VNELCARVEAVFQKKEGRCASKIQTYIQRLAWNFAGIVRDEAGLKTGLNGISMVHGDLEQAVGFHAFEVLEVRNLALTAESVLYAALKRGESRGTHRRSDFPRSSQNLAGRHTHIRYNPDGTLSSSMMPG